MGWAVLHAVAGRAQQDGGKPGGTVIFSRGSGAEAGGVESQVGIAAGEEGARSVGDLDPAKKDPLGVSDLERSALTFTAYDLDVHLISASSAITVRAVVTVRNDGAAPLARLVLQISSSMRWDAIRGEAISGVGPLQFVTRRLATDADHTGWAQEAVIALPVPLAAGASMTLTTLYSGAIAPSAARLERIGGAPGQAADADWDAVGGGEPTAMTALRGFGNVLWYPVASPAVFLGDGAKLFQAEGGMRVREAGATVRMRLAVEFAGEPPDAAFFCGRREQLTIVHDNPEMAVAESSGVATAIFEARPLGFRVPSLFVTVQPPSLIGTPAHGGLIAAVTSHEDALPGYSAAAALVEPVLMDWFGARPMTALNVIDHPGQPFEDDALLVRPMSVETAGELAPSLAHSLTHAWIHSSHAWIDEGMAEFAGLLWVERSAGRAAALEQMQRETRALALVEPVLSSAQRATEQAGSPGLPGSPSGAGQSLVGASSEVYYRTKAATVWWMLRGVVGDDVLKRAIKAYRGDAKLDVDAAGFEHELEGVAHQDLRWFFEDWVYRDRGLPDLSILNVTPRQLEARDGLPAGWLVSIEVRNDGDAVAEVPVTVRSAIDEGSTKKASVETERMRIPGHSSLSRRIVFSGTPDEVQVNDGSVPEAGSSVHFRRLGLPRN